MNTLLLTKDSEGTNAVQLIVNSELMVNQAAATVVDPQNMMKAVQDHAGNAILFSIGSDHSMYVIVTDASSTSGWSQYNISSGIDSNLQAQTFDVAQSADGQLLIALAMAPKGSSDKSTLYLTPLLSNDPTLTDWSNLASKWMKRPFPNGDVKIKEIVIDSGNDSSVTPLGIAAVKTSDTDEHYWINMNASDTSWTWQKFTLPENAQNLQDMAIGIVQGDIGVYALYQTSAGQSLEFTSLPDPKYHKSASYSFSLPGNVNAIAALPGSGNSYDLYAAGDSIYVYPSSTTSGATTIASATNLSDIHELIVTQDTDNASIFTVSGDNELYHCAGVRSDYTSWGTPIMIRDGVSQITAFRNTSMQANTIFTVKNDSSLTFQYQDPASTLWKESQIQLSQLDTIQNFNCYTTHIHLNDSLGQPMMNKTIQMTASSWTFATINGQLHSIDPNTPVSVTTDLMGNVTIINVVHDLSTPVFRLQGSYFDEIVDIDPSAQINSSLTLIQSSDDLKNAKLQDGSPLVDPNTDSDNIDAAAGALQQLTSYTFNAPTGGSQMTPSTQALFATNRSASEPGRHLLRLQGRQQHVWGLTFTGGKATFLDHAAATTHLRALSTAGSENAMLTGTASNAFAALNWLEVAFGDAYEWIKEKIDDVEQFFVQVGEDVLEFVFKIGELWFKFEIMVLEEVFRAISWVLNKTLGIDINKFIDWLGFIFDWDDIKRVHKALVNLANQSMEFGKNELKQFEDKVSSFFEQLKNDLKNLEGPTVPQDNIFAAKNQYVTEQSSDTVSMQQKTNNTPGSYWGQYHLMHGGVADNTDAGVMNPSDAINDFFKDVVYPTLTSIQQTITQLGEDLQTAFSDQSITFSQVLEMLGSDLLIGIVDAMETIVVGMIKLMEDLMSLYKDGLNQKIDIPFFSAFYKTLSDDDLSALDAIMLVYAIPATIGYKLIVEQTPITDDNDLFIKGDYKQIFGLLMGTDGSSDSTSLLAAVATAKNKNDDSSAVSGPQMYSYLGGLTYLVASLASDALTLWGAVTQARILDEPNFEKQEALTKKLESIELFSMALSFGKLVGSFPVGGDKEVWYQRGTWFTYLVGAIGDMALPTAVRKAINDSAVPVTKGLWKMLIGAVVFGLEITTTVIELKEENQNDPNQQNEKGDSITKIIQNTLYFISDEAGGIANMTKGEPQWLAALGSGSAAAFAAIFNLIRLIMNADDALEHQNF
ncbi:hypothetical protein [Paenibacillus sp.]|uniref:hypothetical protein n=1 Tax=Paenibacillus sp. TaxID=58172 RepID=UPI00281161D6|nr:hypothetical protein [Paenibacillus sp.]